MTVQPVALTEEDARRLTERIRTVSTARASLVDRIAAQPRKVFPAMELPPGRPRAEAHQDQQPRRRHGSDPGAGPMNRQPLPDFVAFLACTAVLVVAGLVAATLAGQALLGFLGWLAS